MAQMLTIPYARQQAYRNPQYVAAMADLMIRRGDTASAAALMKGQNTQQLMQNLGTLTMGTFAGIGKQRDEERDRAIIQAERDREHALKQREMEERAADRKADLEYRQRTEKMALSDRREAAADKAVDRIQVGTELPMSAMTPFTDTSAMSAFQKLPGREATLPARSIVDEKMGYSGYADPVEMNRGRGEPDWVPQTGETDWLLPTKRTMDTDYEARPERMKRVASQQELVQLETLRRQAEAAQQLAQDRKDDNAARDKAATATAEYRAKQIELGQARVDRGRMPTTASLALAAAGGDPKKALEIIQRTEEGKDPKKMARFSVIAGAYQNSPLVKAADRTVVLDDAIKAIRANPSDPASQTQLAYSFIQVLDTYQSAVREGELRNIGGIDSVIGALQRRAEGVLNQNQVMNADTATSIANTSARMITAIESARKQKAADFAARAQVEGIGDMWNEYRALSDAATTRTTSTTPTTPTSPINDPAKQPKPRP